MKKKIILKFCFLILFSSCEFSSDYQKGEKQFLKKTKSVSFPLDENSTYEFFIFQIVEDSLLVLNKVNYSLDIYSFSQEKLIDRIEIEREGVNGIKRLNTFYYHNQDSIFLFPQFLLKNSLIIDVAGKIKGRLQHNEFKSDIEGMVNHVSIPSAPSYLFGQDLHFSVFPLLDESIEDENFVSEFSLNLISGEFTSYDYVKKPKIFHHKRWMEESFKRLKVGPEEWYFSWNLSDTVYHIKGQNGVLKESISIPMNGGLKTNPQSVPKEKIKEVRTKMMIEGYVYGKIMIDQEKNVIHRIRFLPMSESKLKESQIKFPYLLKDFEILSYKLDGEFLGSTEFKSGVYDPSVSFLGPGGIYLPKIHPEYSGLIEDEIVYDIFSER